MKREHTSHDFEAELRELRAGLVAMGTRCERALQLAVTAFIDRDAAAAAEVIALDERIDRDEIDLDDLALRILALRQPVAYDLRFITTALKFVTDLERIGDKATSIAKRANELSRATLVPAYPEIGSLSDTAQGMLRDAMDAFVAGDVAKAEAVLARVPTVDEIARRGSNAVVAWMREHPDEISTGLAVLSAGRQLKRVADHASNLAEQVVFIVRGDDVRHRRGPRAPEANERKTS